MIEVGQHPRFALESLDALRVIGEAVGQNLQRDRSAEDRVLGAVDLTHTPSAEQGYDAVLSESRSDH